MTLEEACIGHQAALEHVRAARSRRERIEGDFEALEKADRFIAQLEDIEAEARRTMEEAHRRHKYEAYWREMEAKGYRRENVRSPAMKLDGEA